MHSPPASSSSPRARDPSIRRQEATSRRATGHIGNNLVRALLARGERVRALVYSAAAPLTAWGRLTGTRTLLTKDAVYTLGSNSLVSHERASRELGYHPRPLRESLADSINWFRETGRLSAAP